MKGGVIFCGVLLLLSPLCCSQEEGGEDVEDTFGYTTEHYGNSMIAEQKESDSKELFIPKEHLCHACLAIVWQIHNHLRNATDMRIKELLESEVVDLFDAKICPQENFVGYEIQKEAGHDTWLIGPGLQRKVAKKFFTMQWKINPWNKRLSDKCYEWTSTLDEVEIYKRWVDVFQYSFPQFREWFCVLSEDIESPCGEEHKHNVIYTYDLLDIKNGKRTNSNEKEEM